MNVFGGDALSAVSSVILLVSGAMALVFPRTVVQMGAGAGLALGAAIATARNGGLAPGLAVLLAGLAATIVVGSIPRSPRENDPIGFPFRVTLTAFAVLSAIVLATGRPLGGTGTLDLNVSWYWAAMVGTVMLIGERRETTIAMGLALVVGALALVTIHVSPTITPPVAIVLASAPVSLATAVRWIDKTT